MYLVSWNLTPFIFFKIFLTRIGQYELIPVWLRGIHVKTRSTRTTEAEISKKTNI